MTGTSRHLQELRERAVRMVLEHGGEYHSEWAAIQSISSSDSLAAPPAAPFEATFSVSWALKRRK